MEPASKERYNSSLTSPQEEIGVLFSRSEESPRNFRCTAKTINLDLLSEPPEYAGNLNKAEQAPAGSDSTSPVCLKRTEEPLHTEGKFHEVSAAKTAKSVKFRSRKTTVACDQFLKDDKALRLAREAVLAGETIVINRKVRGRKGYASSPFSLTPASPTTIRVQVDPIGAANRKKLKPLPFSRVADLVRARFCYDALVSMGPVRFVSINLSDDIIAKAYQQPNFLDWIARRIKRELKNALGRDVELYLLLEELCIDDLKRESIRPHLHGAMQINANEIRLARKAVRKAAGEWRTGSRQFQIRFQAKHDFDAGAYAAKQSWKTKPRMRAFLERVGAGRRYVPSFKGGVFTTTKAVREKAAELYARAVEDVLAARRGALLIGTNEI